jgi:hypothetical protein
MKQLSAAAVDRAMKLQDVMLQAMAKRIGSTCAATSHIQSETCPLSGDTWWDTFSPHLRDKKQILLPKALIFLGA